MHFAGLLAVMPCMAPTATVDIFGSTGQLGLSGSSGNPGTSGGDGTMGGDAQAIAGPNADVTNIALATVGAGGAGGGVTARRPEALV